MRSLVVEQSTRILVRGFSVAPTGATGVIVRRSSCDLTGVTVDGAASALLGFLVDSNSDVLLGNVGAVNVKNGISVQRRSTVTAHGSLSLEGLFPTAISDGSVGLLLAGGSQMTANLDGSSAVRGFSTGVAAHASSPASLFVSTDPARSSKLAVENNRSTGIVVSASDLTLIGPAVVSGNGHSGVAVHGGSLELSMGVRIDNNASGILLRNNATASIVADTQFNRNTTGLTLQNGSVVDFGGPLITFVGNVTDVSCDAFSLAAGVSNLTNATVACVNQN
jgi:hypothetical protein